MKMQRQVVGSHPTYIQAAQRMAPRSNVHAAPPQTVAPSHAMPMGQMQSAAPCMAQSMTAQMAEVAQPSPTTQQPQAPSKDTFVVFTTGQDREETVVRTLVGEYVERGVNHGRKVYQKVNNKGVTDFVDVLMYYWDGRDGPAFEGWWFGNKLGGTQVWSHCKDSSLLPPNIGWKVPWDGAVRQTLNVMNAEIGRAHV